MKRFGMHIALIAVTVVLAALVGGCGASGQREGMIGPGTALPVQKGDPVLPAASGYAGSQTCSSCHPQIFSDWSRTLHNMPLKTVAELGDAIFVNDSDGNGRNDFKDNLDLGAAGPAVDNVFLAFGANAPKLSFAGGKYFVAIGTVRYEVQRVQGGNGYWKQRYHTRIGRSYYILPVQYNEVEKRYTIYDGENWYDGSNTPRFTAPYGSDNLVLQFAALNNGTDRKGTAASFENRCAGCHQTGFAARSDNSVAYGGSNPYEVVTGYVELNIGCEACHGPGAAHAASRNAADIVNPNNFLIVGVPGIQRANEVCGSCHSRGTSVQLPGMSAAMEAPALLSGNAVTPFRPGNNLLNDLGASGYYVTLTTSPADLWGSANFAASDVNRKFPLFNASRRNHQQFMDIGQGPHAADQPFDVPCWGCHSPHSAANRHMIATTVAEGGVVKVSGTKEENDTLCLACHNGTYAGDFASLTTADVQAVADGNGSPAVDNAIRNHLIRRANMDVELDLPKGVGRCTACHMPLTARSADYGAAFVDADGKRKGDIHAHTLELLMPNANVVDVDNTFFNRTDPTDSLRATMPNSCSGCHKGAPDIDGNFEIYGWARSAHANYLDVGIGGFSDPLIRNDATREAYNNPVNGFCRTCHTEAGYVTFLAGRVPSARLIAPTEKNFLNCNACHDPASPAASRHVRQPASIAFPSGLAVSGAGNSMVCMKCHGGLASKASVDAAVPDNTGKYAPVTPHHLVASAMLYGPESRGGYEYDNTHSAIAPGSAIFYGNNPFHIETSCAGCHMTAVSGNWNLGGHTLEMDDGAGTLNTVACSNLLCHGPVTTFNLGGKDAKGQVAALLGALDAALAASGVSKLADFPFFDNITTAVQLRAAYNDSFVSNDPAGYVHNWQYAAQLVYDALDEMNDGTLNGNVVLPPGVVKAQFGR